MAALRARQEKLQQMHHDLPEPPSARAISQLRQDLLHVLMHGTPGQRKAVIETHIDEIKIGNGRLTPICKIPIDQVEQTKGSQLTPLFAQWFKLWA